LLAINCPCLVEDISKIFTVYWELSNPTSVIPAKWPSSLSTLWNIANPASLEVNGTNASVFLAVSDDEVVWVTDNQCLFSPHQQNYALLVELLILMLYLM